MSHVVTKKPYNPETSMVVEAVSCSESLTRTNWHLMNDIDMHRPLSSDIIIGLTSTVKTTLVYTQILAV